LVDIDALTAQIEAQVRAAQDHAVAMKAWAAEIESLTGSGSALRGAVKVEVNHSGVLTSLKLTDAALDAGPNSLAAAILAAVEAATQAVADETGRSAASQFGRDGEVTRLMVADLTKRLRVTPDLDGPAGEGYAGGPRHTGGVLG